MSSAKAKDDKRPNEDKSIPTVGPADVIGERGSQIGPYKQLRVLGEGGFAVVYLAEQQEPVKRRVALKVIKPGMDTKQVIARFEAERQALALLDHPHIAHVFDAGTTEAGRPYFVMEYVQGVPITEHCDRFKLTVEERLRLFLSVCDAVQHAHQKAIIHRDIKPSNVLVAYDGEQAIPMIIDFGLAKALSQPLTERTLVTEQAQMIGTPEYMSPEQAEMTSQDIDTRTDIYSLGVLLYALLAGTLPFDPHTLREGGAEKMRRMIREHDPRPPSTRLSTIERDESVSIAQDRRTDIRTLGRRLHGELDWITLKAMDKDRTRRYQTAHVLAEDIQRYLDQEPVLAGPPSTVYRLRKFVARNRGLVCSVATVALILLVATIVSLSQMVSARRAEKTAEEARLEEAKQRQRAQAQELIARQRAYSSDMNLANQALSVNNLGRARHLLIRQRPSASHSRLTDSDDLRGWEWRYLWQQCRGDALYEFCQRTGGITSLSVSHDGRLLAIGEREGGGVSIWNLTTRERVKTFFSHGREARVAFSPQDLILAFSAIPSINPDVPSLPDYDQCYIRLWDEKTDQIIRELPLAGSCFDLEFSEDGRSLVSLSADGSASDRKEMGKITVWSVPEGKRLPSFDARARIINTETLAISPDKKFAVYIERGEHRIRLVDLVTGQERWPATTNHSVSTLAVSRDSRVLASSEGLDEPAIRLWDVESLIEIGCLKGHRSWICDLCFCPDGKRLMSASADQTIRVWDVSDPCNGELLYTFRGHDTEVWRIALLPDNRTLVSGGKDGSICVWDTQKQPFDVGPVIRANVSSFRFAPDGSGVLIVDGNGCVTRLQGPGFREEHDILSVNPDTTYSRTLISPDNRLLAAPLRDGTIEVWDLQSRIVCRTISCRPSTEPLAFLAHGRRLVTFERNGDSHDVWDLTTGQHIQSWAGAAKLSPWVSPTCTTDGRLMLTLRFFKALGVLRDMTTGRQTHLDLDITETSGVSFSPNGELIAACSHLGFVKLWAVDTFRELATLEGFLLGAHSVAFSPDGQRLAAGSDSLEAVKIWDVETHQELLTLPGQGWRHWRAAFSPDGDALGTMSGGGQLHLWRAPSWEEIARAEEASPAKTIWQ